MNTTDLLSLYKTEKEEHDPMSDDVDFPTFREWRKRYESDTEGTFVNLATAAYNQDLISDVDPDALNSIAHQV